MNPSPLRYPGGKYKIYNYVKDLIQANNCTSYIEPFSGGSAVAIQLLLDDQVKKITLNDYDPAIYAFWHSVLYKTDEIVDKIKATDITIEEWYKQREIQLKMESDDLLSLGFSTLYLNRTNRSGIIKAGVIGGKLQNSKEYKMDCRFNKKSIIERIKAISNLSEKIELHNMDAIDLIDKIIKKTRNSFTFFDPPYYKKGPSLYTNFYSDGDHSMLAKKIKQNLRNRKWIVTYDHCDEIKSKYSNLEYLEFHLNYSVQNKTLGKEFMFFSKLTSQPDYISLKLAKVE